MISDDEAKELKAWVIKKLEDISDADSDVLADYVLALFRADSSEPELRESVVSNLEDFLKDNTATFVDDVLIAIHTKSYLPGYVPPAASTLPSPGFAAPPTSFNAPTGPSNTYGSQGARNGGGSQQSRKRTYNEVQEGRGGYDAGHGRGDRQMKHLRRGDMGGGRGGGLQGRMDYQAPGSMPALSNLPPLSHDMAGVGHQTPPMPLDFNDPFAAMLAMQALGFPGMPPLPQLSPPPTQGGDSNWSRSNPPMKNRINARCRDYDTKGYCTRGNACPFNHGDNPIMVSAQQDEYDPNNAGLMDIQKPLNGINGQVSHESSRGHPSGRGRGQGRGDRGGFVPQRKNRADFSLAGPNHDRSITSVVVEQIPEDKFDEQSVKGFFSDFGPVEEVTMQAYKRLAIVRFSDYPSAKRAYESPKVIFDNRFVKVYWYKPENVPTPTNGSATKAGSPNTADKPEEQPFDKEKFERDSIAAQKKMEEKKTLMKEAEAKRLELEKQKEELAKKQEEEKRKLMEKLKAKEKTGTSGDSATKDKVNAGLNGAQDSKANKQTEVLRATLAALEEEAVSLGIDPATAADPPSYRGRGRGRGRGSYRGWEGFAGRGRGYDPSRGPSRGRASFRGARGGVVYNLDNRTKKVKVSGVNFDSQKDEVLRQHLLGVGEFEDIEPTDSSNPSQSQTITFKDRFTAEKFMYGSKDLSGIGLLEFSWVNTPLPPVAMVSTKVNGLETEDMDMGGASTNGDNSRDFGGQHVQAEVDYDVAEDDDWGAGL